IWEAAISGAEVFDRMTKEFIKEARIEIWFPETSLIIQHHGMKGYYTADAGLECILLAPISLDRPNPIGTGAWETIHAIAFAYILRIPGQDAPQFEFLEPMANGDSIPDHLKPLVAASHFMRLPLVSKEEVKPPRHFRRRAEREKRKLSKVHV